MTIKHSKPLNRLWNQKTIRYLAFITFISCITIDCKNTMPDNDEYAIMNIAFDNIMGHDSAWRELQLLKYLGHFYTPEDSANYANETKNIQRLRDSIKQIVDTNSLYVYINDTLIDIKKDLIQLNSITKDSFALSFPKIDTSFIPLIHSLRDYKYPKNAIKISDLSTTYNYKLESVRKYDRNVKFNIAQVSFSHLSLNSLKTKACIYVEMICGGTCGHGKLYFFEKRNRKWFSVGERSLWVH